MELESALTYASKKHLLNPHFREDFEHQAWAQTEGFIHRGLAAYVMRRFNKSQKCRSQHEKLSALKTIVKVQLEEAGLLGPNGRRVCKPRGMHKLGKVSHDGKMEKGSSRLSSSSSTSTAPTELEVYGHDNSDEALEIQNQVREKHEGEEGVAEEVELLEPCSMVEVDDEGFDEMDQLLHCSGIGLGWDTDMEEEEEEEPPLPKNSIIDPTQAETLPLDLTENSQWKLYERGTPPYSPPQESKEEKVPPKDIEGGSEIESEDDKKKKARKKDAVAEIPAMDTALEEEDPDREHKDGQSEEDERARNGAGPGK